MSRALARTQGTQLPSRLLAPQLPRQVHVPAIRTFSHFTHFNRVYTLSSNTSISSSTTSTTQFQRNYTVTAVRMGVEKTIISAGNGPKPQKGDVVTMEYTGWLADPSAGNGRGAQFDSSVGRGDFVTPIGVGRVIKGWDEGVTQMQLGEKATLNISPDFGYGSRGFPGAIPANSTLIFDVELKKIN